jgi:hypothetical protein
MIKRKGKWRDGNIPLAKASFYLGHGDFTLGAELPQQALLDRAKHALALTPKWCLGGYKPIEMRQKFSSPCL